jgi:hypothetical protein
LFKIRHRIVRNVTGMTEIAFTPALGRRCGTGTVALLLQR